MLIKNTFFYIGTLLNNINCRFNFAAISLSYKISLRYLGILIPTVNDIDSGITQHLGYGIVFSVAVTAENLQGFIDALDSHIRSVGFNNGGGQVYYIPGILYPRRIDTSFGKHYSALQKCPNYDVYINTANKKEKFMLYAKEEVGAIVAKTSAPAITFAINETNMTAASGIICMAISIVLLNHS